MTRIFLEFFLEVCYNKGTRGKNEKIPSLLRYGNYLIILNY